MAKQIYSLKDYPRSNPRDPLTSEWTIRSAIIAGRSRYVLIRKVNGIKQRRLVIDNRYRNRTPGERSLDEKIENLKKDWRKQHAKKASIVKEN